MQSSPASHHFLPLKGKYSPQHPVLKHPQFVPFPYCERPTFITTLNNSIQQSPS
jgi:hypothetical protein